MKEESINSIKENEIISKKISKVKIFGNTEISSKINVVGIKVTKGAKLSIEKAGGSVAE